MTLTRGCLSPALSAPQSDPESSSARILVRSRTEPPVARTDLEPTNPQNSHRGESLTKEENADGIGGEVFEIHMPITGPPSKVLLSANTRMHWRSKATRTRYWREWAHLAARSKRPDLGASPLLQWAHIDAWICWPDNRRRDVGNLFPTIKACVDGLVDARIIPDDSDEFITGPDLRRGYGPAAVTIRVMALECSPRQVAS